MFQSPTCLSSTVAFCGVNANTFRFDAQDSAGARFFSSRAPMDCELGQWQGSCGKRYMQREDTKKLKELGVRYSAPTADDLEGLVSSCNQDFLALRQLELHIINMNDVEVVQALTPLKNHPSLSRVKCGWYDQDEKGSFFRDFCDAMGGKIQVTETPYHQHE